MPSNTPRPSKPRRPSHESTVLVLQGGGALGAYQGGVYEGMQEAGVAPNWITGVSIGAINAALIAGNRPENRITRLRAFGERVSSGVPVAVPAPFDFLRLAFNRWSASASAAFGVPGFFAPRVPPTMFNPPRAFAGRRTWDGDRRAAARLAADPGRGRAVLGRRSRLEHAAVVRARRQRAIERVDRSSRL